MEDERASHGKTKTHENATNKTNVCVMCHEQCVNCCGLCGVHGVRCTIKQVLMDQPASDEMSVIQV